MEHFYQGIPGWFDFEDLYRAMVQSAPDPAHFVEVGAWLGKSTAYLAVEIARSAKAIRLDVVDHWQGGFGQNLHRTIPGQTDVFAAFEENMRRGGVRESLNVIREASPRAAQRYRDGALDFVFLDGSHDFLSVFWDVLSWKPKLRPGGTLAGHDWGRFQVRPAVLTALPASAIRTWGSCWVAVV